MGDVVRTCRLERAAAAVDAALQCIFQMAVDHRLQVRSSCNPMNLCAAELMIITQRTSHCHLAQDLPENNLAVPPRRSC